MVTNPYYIRARLFPTILTCIPLLVFVNKMISLYFYEQLKAILEVLPLLTGLGLSAALLFLSVQINRLIAKEMFQKFYFKDEIKMPTTNHLLWQNDLFDKTIKENIRFKIHSKFGITLMNEVDESANENASRKQIATAVSQIRNALRDNRLLFQHNIEYGFFRNLLGGCFIACIFSLSLILLGQINKEQAVKLTGIVLFFIYLFPIVFSKVLVNRFGNYYSKILYEQFLTL